MDVFLYPTCRASVAAVFVDVHVHPPRVAAGHDARARRRADAAGDVEIGEPHPLLGHPVDVGRAVELRAITANVAVPQIVADDEDEVGRLLRGAARLGPR